MIFHFSVGNHFFTARFSYDRYDRCDRWEKKFSDDSDHRIIWKPLSSDRKSSISTIVVAAIAEEWFQYGRIAVVFFLSDRSDRSDHMETELTTTFPESGILKLLNLMHASLINPGSTFHNEVKGILILSLRGKNCEFWSHLKCQGRKANNFIHTKRGGIHPYLL